jgi:hypothetical protein
LCFTHLDGLVLARSAYHHSMNYRCAVVYGEAEELVAEAEKRAALDALLDQVAAGRSQEARAANAEELRATKLVAVRIVEASAKIRTGPVLDDAADIETSTAWAGVIPLSLRASMPQRATDCLAQLAPLGSVATRTRSLGGEVPFEVHDLGLCFSSDRSRIDESWVHRALTESYWAKGVKSALLVSFRTAPASGTWLTYSSSPRTVGAASVNGSVASRWNIPRWLGWIGCC